MEKTEIGFDKTNTFPIMVKHTVRPAADGQLEHWMDDKLRATVPPESWDAYCKEWPVCRDVADSLLRPSPSTVLQETVNAMLHQSQELVEGTEIILPVTMQPDANEVPPVQNTENPDHPE